MNTLNNEILSAIDKIDEVADEASICVIESYMNLCKKYYTISLYDQNLSDQEVYMEGIGTFIKKGLNKFCELIKKSISIMSALIRNMLFFVKKLVGKNKRNINNILLADDTIELYAVESGSDTTDIQNLFFIDMDGDVFDVHLNPFSKAKIKEINRSIKNINIDGPFGTRQMFGYAVISALRNPVLMDDLFECIKCIQNKNGKLFLASDQMLEFWNKYTEGFRNANNITLHDIENQTSIHLNVDNIQKLNARINRIQKYVDTLWHTRMDDYEDLPQINNNKSDVSRNPRYFLELINQELVNFNMGLNSFNKDLKSMYILHPNLHHCVKTIQQLDTFVFNMLESGYPSKHIANNIELSISDSLTGSNHSTKNGQTRFVVIPDDKSCVYKCAINSSGLSANKNENTIYKKFKKFRGEHFLASVLDIGKNQCVLKQEYCDEVKNLSCIDKDKLYDDIDIFTSKHKNIRFIWDRKFDAIRRHVDTGELCVADYGIISAVVGYEHS